MPVHVKHGHRRIEQHRSRKKHAGGLGRHVEFDKKSAKYKVAKVIPIKVQHIDALGPVVWPRPTGAFNQALTSSCTGNGVEGQACTYPHRVKGHRYTEVEAKKVYAAATAIDPFPGTWYYPPAHGDDTGSSVLAAIKAAIARGLFGADPQYNWVFGGAQELAAAVLTIGPATVGVNWYEGFDRPDASGLVQIAGGIRGGHAFEVLGYDPSLQQFLAINSWGPYWGKLGRFIVPLAAMDRLLHEDGEATVVTTRAAA